MLQARADVERVGGDGDLDHARFPRADRRPRAAEPETEARQDREQDREADGDDRGDTMAAQQA